MFNFFRRRNTSEEQRALTEEQYPWLAFPPTAAGITVSPEVAMRSPTTLAATRAIYETVGSLPVHVFKRGDKGAKDRATDHPAEALLTDGANPWTGAAELRMQVQRDALFHAAGYAQVIKVNGKVTEIHRLDPVSTTVDMATGEPRFKVGADKFLGYRDVIRIAAPGSTFDRPIKLTELAREAIALDLAMARHQAKLFSNGARPGGIIKIPGKLGKDAVARIRTAWQGAHGGENTAGTAVMEEGAEWQSITLSLVDAQFLELRRFVCQEIARAFKVPATLVGDLERAVWSNIEELSRQFLTYTLLPWLEVWQAALQRALFTDEERKNYFVEFVIDDLVRADLAARCAALRNAIGGAWLTPNEGRALDNRPPIEGGDELIRQAGQSDTGDQTVPVPIRQPLRAAA